MGANASEDSCWLSSFTTLQLSRQDNGRTRCCKRVTTTRLLAFLKDPTQGNWDRLCPTTTRAIDDPFSHFCGNGAAMTAGNTSGCINGLDHGRFESRAENEGRKACTNGARCLCPGHGRPPVRCLFQHADGRPKPCRNHDGHVPECRCSTRCFG